MIQEFLRRLTVMYGAPKTDSPEAFYREYHEALSPFSSGVIDRAASKILRTHKYKNWPSIADCLAAAHDAASVDTAIARPQAAATPMFVLDRDVDRLQWADWMPALRDDQREEAEQTGVIVVTSNWPANGKLIAVGNHRTYSDLVNSAGDGWNG